MPAIAEFAHLLRQRPFRRLTLTRVLAQAGDGVFQASLASLLFFDPTRAADAPAIASGFLLLLAPYTLAGPLVGPFIDRWQRQQILLWGNVARLVLALVVGVAMATSAPAALLYVAALATLSLNRLLLAAMSAGIPRVAAPAELLMANSAMVTLGTVSAVAGGGIGVAVAALAPSWSGGSAALTTLAVASITFAGSAAAAAAIGRTDLGPETTLKAGDLRAALAVSLRGIRQGAAYLALRVTPLHALLVMSAHRLLYGVMLVAAILMSRQFAGAEGSTAGGAGQFGLVLACAGVGFALAAVLTPVLGAPLSRQAWVVACLLVGAGGQVLLAASGSRWSVLAAAAIVSFAVQGAKLALDTIIQRDTDDDMRGRAFSFYDVGFNVGFVAAAAVAAVTLPADGHSTLAMALLAGGYLALAASYSRAPRIPAAA